jgi:Dolichyl-phosphate-mannose-protein mannosyltransferase
VRVTPSGLLLVGICVLAAVLRLVGLQYGLPAVYNPDEVSIMARALSFAKGTLNPHNFLYPTFYFYVLFVCVGAYLALLWLTGRVSSLAALQQRYFTDPIGIYTTGRALGAATGVATVFLLHRLTARLTDQRTALGAALFLAVAPLHVRDAHYVKHDVPATLAVVAAYLALTRLWPCARPEGPTTRDTLIAGAACGMAFAIHYYCVFLGIPLLFVIAQGWRAHGGAVLAKQIGIGIAASALTFFVLSPFVVLEPVTALRDIAANRRIVVDRAVTTGAFAPAVRYAELLLKDSMGLPVVLLGLAGAIWMLVTKPSRAALLLLFPLPFLAFIANTAPATRYLNPVLPFLAVFAAWLLSEITNRWRTGPWVFWIAVVLAAVPGTLASIHVDWFLRQDDTRTLAARYIEAEIPSGSTILIQPYSAPLTPSRQGLMEALSRAPGGVDGASVKFRLQLSLDPYPQPSYRLLYLGRGGLDAEKIYIDPTTLGGATSLERLRQLGVTYIVVTRYNDPEPATLPFLAALSAGGRRLATFSPYRSGISEAEQARIEPFLHNTDARIVEALARPGPRLEIWQLQ